MRILMTLLLAPAMPKALTLINSGTPYRNGSTKDAAASVCVVW